MSLSLFLSLPERAGEAALESWINPPLLCRPRQELDYQGTGVSGIGATGRVPVPFSSSAHENQLCCR